MLLLSLGLMAGCDQFNDIKNTVDGLTNPLVAQTIILGVAEPESSEIDLSGTDFSQGATIQAFLADAASVNDLENAPVSGADVKIRVGETAAVWLTESADGAYSADGTDGFSYVAQQPSVVTMNYGDDSSQMSITLPAAVNVDVPETHNGGTAMNLDLGASFDAVLAVVIDVTAGEATWTNRPETIREVYDFTHGSGNVSSLTIPAVAFPSGCACAVGIAGMENADSSNFTNTNTGLSSLSAGKMKFYGVVVP
ncbi:MAG: hypothetical protein H6739_37380 [Alphaproteobacteria bacterium]|nr:hypothetical protein [Alphaproteobacteria bacterium]